MTLVRSPTLRVVLIALHQGTVIPSHQAEGPITVQVLEGQMKCSAAGQVVTLGTGQMLTLHSGLPHVVEAVKETAFLLILTTRRHTPRSDSGTGLTQWSPKGNRVMGKTPPYLDPNSHEALYEVDVGVVDMIDQLQTIPDEHDQDALNC